MDDHPLPAPAANGAGHNGWHAGQAVALRRGNLAGWRGVLVRCNDQRRWIVSLERWQPGVFLSVDPESLTPLEEPAAELPSPAEISLPPLAPEGPRIAKE